MTADAGAAIETTPSDGGPSADEGALRLALEQANLPTLLLVLAQLTGERRWLEEPYKPTRTVALNDNDSGGFAPERQAEIRAAALRALKAWRAGERELLPPPDDEQLIEMLSVSLGEQVPTEYGPSMAEEAGFTPRQGVEWTDGRPPAADEAHVLVVGAGPSGIAMGATLERLGIDYTIIEKNPEAGGVWLENDYPGAGVDTPVHMYSFSFSPRPGWTRFYPKQPEVLEYMQSAARDAGVLAHVRFDTEVLAMDWSNDEHTWNVRVRGSDGAEERLQAKIVISCVGQLNRPAMPDLPGTKDFAGPMFHSARWRHDLDLAGKRVAVIGTGATAMQIVPAIADVAERVLVFQRTPQWVAPNPNYLRTVPEGSRLLMERLPYYASFYRLRLIWQFQDKLLATLHRDPEWPHPDRAVNAVNDRHRVYFTKHLEAELADRADLIAKALPNYPPYGKRILMDNDWFKTIRREDVELIAEAVSGFDRSHVLTADGVAHAADVVVFATGFHASRMLWPMEIRGRSGQTLRQRWGDHDASAYLGMSVPDFPNMFIVGGPHTSVGHGGSVIYSSEMCVAYIARVLIAFIERQMDTIEIRQDVTDAYNKRIDEEHENLIWTHPGMTNWFRNPDGRVLLIMPWRGVDFWHLTQMPDFDDYLVTS